MLNFRKNFSGCCRFCPIAIRRLLCILWYYYFFFFQKNIRCTFYSLRNRCACKTSLHIELWGRRNDKNECNDRRVWTHERGKFFRLCALTDDDAKHTLRLLIVFHSLQKNKIKHCRSAGYSCSSAILTPFTPLHFAHSRVSKWFMRSLLCWHMLNVEFTFPSHHARAHKATHSQ